MCVPFTLYNRHEQWYVALRCVRCIARYRSPNFHTRSVSVVQKQGAEGMGHTRGGGGGGGGGGTDGVEEDDTLDDDLRRPPGGATLAELNDDEVPSLTSATTGAEAIPAHASPGTTIRTAEAAISGVGAAAKKKDETAAAVVEMPALVTLGANDDADY